MARSPRGPVADRLVEVTTRTVQSRFLLRPSRKVNEIFKGVVARAQQLTGMRIVAYSAMSNHVHMLIVPESGHQMAEFMREVNGNLARKLGDHFGWKGPFWSRRYTPVVVSHEYEAQLAKLLYLLKQGTKENLVAKPGDWPGAHTVAELCRGYTEITGGVWHDKDGENEARRRGKVAVHEDFVNRNLTIQLSPLPCWSRDDRMLVAERIRNHVREIEHGVRQRHEAEGTRPLGVKAVLRAHPFDSPEDSSRSPAPRFAAASREALAELVAEWRAFLDQYRQATEALKAGLSAAFPPGSFPPGLPYVPDLPSP